MITPRDEIGRPFDAWTEMAGISTDWLVTADPHWVELRRVRERDIPEPARVKIDGLKVIVGPLNAQSLVVR
jgi:hypothetical protein